jgi:hypothetical protein
MDNLDNSIMIELNYPKLFSENTYLDAGIKTKKRKDGTTYRTTYLYKQSGVRTYQNVLVKQVFTRYYDLVSSNPDLFNGKIYHTEFTYNLSSNNKINRDLSNFKKLIEDALVNGINKILSKSGSKFTFDDHKIYKSLDEKVITDNDSESVVIKLIRID